MKDKEKNIDQFIKKALEQADVSFDEHHWEAMEAKLDQEMPTVPNAGGSGFSRFTNTFTIATIIGMLWLLFSFPKKEVTKQSITETPTLQEGTLSNLDSKDDPTTQMTREKAVTKPLESNTNVTAKETTEPIPQPSKNEQLTSRDEIAGQPANPSFTRTEAQPVNQSQKSGKTGPGMEKIPSDHYYPHDTKSIFVLIPVDLPTNGHIPGPIEFAYPSDSTSSGTTRKPKRSVLAGISLSPEFSSVGFLEKASFSGLIGGIIQYQHGENWMVATGISYTNKQYEAPGTEYNPPTGFWTENTEGEIPDLVDGSCRVIDIPLMLGYNWTPKRKVNWISQIGISSYFLLDEGYQFQFNGYGGGRNYSWHSKENSQVKLGIVSASIAAQWHLKERVYFRIEPYFKIPFKEIGWGRIDLHSTGTLFSLLYSISPP